MKHFSLNKSLCILHSHLIILLSRPSLNCAVLTAWKSCKVHLHKLINLTSNDLRPQLCSTVHNLHLLFGSGRKLQEWESFKALEMLEPFSPEQPKTLIVLKQNLFERNVALNPLISWKGQKACPQSSPSFTFVYRSFWWVQLFCSLFQGSANIFGMSSFNMSQSIIAYLHH